MLNLYIPALKKDKHCNHGVYRINCSDCDIIHMGQTVSVNKRHKNNSLYSDVFPQDVRGRVIFYIQYVVCLQKIFALMFFQVF